MKLSHDWSGTIALLGVLARDRRILDSRDDLLGYQRKSLPVPVYLHEPAGLLVGVITELALRDYELDARGHVDMAALAQGDAGHAERLYDGEIIACSVITRDESVVLQAAEPAPIIRHVYWNLRSLIIGVHPPQWDGIGLSLDDFGLNARTAKETGLLEKGLLQ